MKLFMLGIFVVVCAQVLILLINWMLNFFGFTLKTNISADLFWYAVTLAPMVETFLFLTVPAFIASILSIRTVYFIVPATIIFSMAHWDGRYGWDVPVMALIAGVAFSYVYLQTLSMNKWYGGYVYTSITHAMFNLASFIIWKLTAGSAV